MKKVYTVVGLSSFGMDSESTVIHAGIDERVALGIVTDSYYHTLHLQTWINGTMISLYAKKSDSKDWNKVHDRLADLSADVAQKENDFLKAQGELQILVDSLKG